MYYEPAHQTSGLPHNPFTACCVPRPIGWISTVSGDGVHNLAPFAQFQNVTFEPPTVLFSHCGWPAKDTLTNALETGEFVWNMATYELREAVALSAMTFPPDIDEFEVTGLETVASVQVKPRRVAASPVQFECRVINSMNIDSDIPEGRATIVVGRVVGIHIDDAAITDGGVVDIAKIRPLARLGYLDYTAIGDVFQIAPELPEGPWKPDDALRGGHPTGLFHMPEVAHDAAE
jgi:flavin reductase (DIM6/NTAB) family NADH-FMN oxidoreductase RutF